MATPTRSQAVSTPKNALSSTPNRPNASPRPNSGAFPNRPLAYKSPAVKTPASGHGHSHRTSQPMSTPLAGSNIPDELLNLNSPGAAALIMGQAGLTPLPTGQDGLGITPGITNGQGRDAVGTRDPQLERARRIRDVADTLRKRATGRNVTRENVEMLAQIHGFDNLWDGDALQLAGSKAVDLEIYFDGDERDKVVRSTLKLNLPDEEGQLQKDASAVLTTNLMEEKNSDSTLPWKSLDPFAHNLEYLDKMEHIDSTANSFHLVGGLYETFQKIWEEEKKRMKWKNDFHHICSGNVGKPVKDTDGSLGLRSKFWTTGQIINNTSPEGEDSANSPKREWIASFLCERGNPPVPSHQTWLGDEPLLNSVTAENLFQDSQVDKPNWQDPTALPRDRTASESMNVDDETTAPLEMLDLRFFCNLQPPILLPMHVANNFNAQMPMIDLDQSRASLFQNALRPDNAEPMQTQITGNSEVSWTKPQYIFDKEGISHERKHSYNFFTNGVAWSYSTNRLQFSHPQQFAEVLPVLRQYALVETLLKSIVSGDKLESDSESKNPALAKQSSTEQHKQPMKRSNKSSAQEKLSLALRSKQMNGNLSLPIDVRFDVVSDVTKAKIECRLPLPRELVVPKARPFLSISIEVRPNGMLEVTDMQGIDAKQKDALAKKLSKVLKVSEDIGIAIEWLLEHLKIEKNKSAAT